MRLLPLIVPLLLIVGTPAAGQDSTAAKPSCEGPEFHQFDFWVGNWDVTARGQHAGTNNVTREEQGCLIHEHWNGGETGQSMNYYDAADHAWHQVWVSSTGQILTFRGTFEHGSLTFLGTRPSQRGSGIVQHRLTFTPNQDGSVRQLWEASRDDGKTWRVIFDGLYRKG